ncbi:MULTISPECIES: radical SAM protein [unclassified Pseudodesulfovibrio]|uniref:radical SAM/SPASM domain-containing protein n=1 Tax=unclassified Pseudodesulfovibrio TaxID=2661612 RepID=UPI000FEBAF43|nr:MULTISPECIES: radical SAM protein [unclassified Pseudodesulfovibrio]MCJ2164929.1 SPASM domain-containing protein [Pseudodesulfovibrio sp. S3-i]RWU03708.1 SPASM domain-containing protein [Pseudodesulfovibrio sp. S3]
MKHIKKLKKGFLVLEPDSLSWVIADSHSEAVRFRFSEAQIRERKDAIQRDRANRRLDLVELHISHKCNLDCRYCYVPNSLKRQPTQLAYADVKFILGKIDGYSKITGKRPAINLHGGEPTLHYEMIKKIITEYGADFKFVMQTNGSILNERQLDFFISRQIDVGFSIDTLSGKCPVRQGLDNSRVIQSIGHMCANGCSPNILVTLSKFNVKTVPTLIKKLHAIGVSSLTLNPITPYTDDAAEHMAPMEDVISTYLSCVGYALDTTRNDPHHPLFINHMESLSLSILTNRSSSYCEMSPCGAGSLLVVIGPNGQVWPCSGGISNQNITLGNIFEEDLLEMLHSENNRIFPRRNVKDIPGCSDCAYRQICGANCPLPAINKGQSQGVKSDLCQLRSTLIDFIFDYISTPGTDILDFMSYQTRKSLLGAHFDATEPDNPLIETGT